MSLSDTMIKINFMKLRNVSCIISILLMLLSIGWIAIYNFNFGIDFTGGVTIEVMSDVKPDLASVRSELNDLELGEVVLQNFGDPKNLLIRVGTDNGVDVNHIVDKVKNSLAQNFDYVLTYSKIDVVGPQIGKQMIQAGLIALIMSFLAIMIYIWFRFALSFGVCIIIALLHDIILSLGFMSLTQYDFNLTTVAAILTITGYSVNNSVVIFDRVRENIRKSSRKLMDDIINNSINSTLSRTTITTLTTLLANGALVLFGGEAIRSFSMLVFFGIVVGTYSSIFISAPILTFVKSN